MEYNPGTTYSPPQKKIKGRYIAFILVGVAVVSIIWAIMIKKENDEWDNYNAQVADYNAQMRNDRHYVVADAIDYPQVVSIDIEEIPEQIGIGESFQLRVNIIVDQIDVEIPQITYVSFDEDIAIVSPDGVITGISEGIVSIEVTCEDKYRLMEIVIFENPL